MIVSVHHCSKWTLPLVSCVRIRIYPHSRPDGLRRTHIFFCKSEYTRPFVYERAAKCAATTRLSVNLVNLRVKFARQIGSKSANPLSRASSRLSCLAKYVGKSCPDESPGSERRVVVGNLETTRMVFIGLYKSEQHTHLKTFTLSAGMSNVGNGDYRDCRCWTIWPGSHHSQHCILSGLLAIHKNALPVASHPSRVSYIRQRGVSLDFYANCPEATRKSSLLKTIQSRSL